MTMKLLINRYGTRVLPCIVVLALFASLHLLTAQKRNEALIRAVEEGELDTVHLLQQKGASGSLATQLFIATLESNPAKVEALISQGAPVNALDSDGDTILMYAARWGGVSIMRLLIKHGADVNAAGSNDGTALMNAVGFNDVEAVKLLLASGARVNAKTVWNNTALDMIEPDMGSEGKKNAAIIRAILKDAGAVSFIRPKA